MTPTLLPLAQTTVIIADHLRAIDTPLDSIRDWVWGVAFLLTLCGFYSRAWRNRRHPERMIEGLAIVAIYILFAASIGFWKQYVVWLCYWPAQELARTSDAFQVHAALNRISAQTTEIMTSMQTSPFSTILDIVSGKVTAEWIFSVLSVAVYSIASILASSLFMPYYVLQHVLAHIMFFFAPIAICALTFPPLSSKGSTYLAMLVSVLLWPLGFAIVAAAANLCFQVAPASFILPLRALMALVIFIVGTILVPPSAFYLCAYGGTHIDPVSSGVRFIPMLGNFGRR